MRFAGCCCLFIGLALFEGRTCSPSILGGLKACSRDGDELNDCLKDAIHSAFPLLASGFDATAGKNANNSVEPALRFPPLEPYRERDLRLDYNLYQVNIIAKGKNVICNGLSKTKVHKVRANIQDDSMEMEVDMSNEKLFVEGTYLLEGNYNAIKIFSKGEFNTTMYNMTWTFKMKGVAEERDGKTYMVIKSFDMRPELGSIDIHIPYLVKGNQFINDYLVGLMKSEWRYIYHELAPAIERIWFKVGSKLSNKIFKKIPYDELFPPEF